MKNKVLFILAVTIILVSTLAVSASAFTITETGSIITRKEASATEIQAMKEVFEKQALLGFIPTDSKLVYIAYDTDVGYMRAMGIRGELSTITTSTTGSYVYYTSTEKNLALYAWTESGWEHETNLNKDGIVRTKLTYSAIPAPAGSYPSIDGFDLSRAGSEDVGAVAVNAYYTQLCDIVFNYEGDIEEAEQNGYEIGYDDGYDLGYYNGTEDGYETGYGKGFVDGKGEGFTMGYNQGKTDGKTECESTHLTLQEQAYDDGYDMGQEMCARTHDTIRQAGYDNGLYDCEQTHEAMKREQYEEGWNEGHATGVSEGYDTGYEEGYEEGDYDGFNRGFDDGMLEAEKLTGEMLQNKYNQGFTDGEQSVLETSKVVTDYVDSLFSAPLNFLYTMLDVEVFGVHLFGIAAAVVALAVVLVVVKIILKVKG